MVNVIELFGGISAFRKGANNIGVKFNTLDYVELNEQAVMSYNILYGENFNPQNIIEFNKTYKDVDLLVHGSPCQSFSLAGKQEGGEKDSGTQSSLLWESIRVIKQNKPKIVIWENVENVLKGKHRKVFNEYLEEMNNLGYSNSYEVLNGIHFGIPQSRKRVFVVSLLGDKVFNFNYDKSNIARNLNEYLDFRDKDDLTFNFYNRYLENINNKATLNEFINYINNLKVSTKGIGTMKMGLYNFDEMDTITTTDNYTGTITCRNSQNYNKKYWHNNKLYRPSPRMCWRLMGFSNDDFDKVENIHIDKYLYNQAGNSIIVNVVEHIFKELKLQGLLKEANND